MIESGDCIALRIQDNVMAGNRMVAFMARYQWQKGTFLTRIQSPRRGEINTGRRVAKQESWSPFTPKRQTITARIKKLSLFPECLQKPTVGLPHGSAPLGNFGAPGIRNAVMFITGVLARPGSNKDWTSDGSKTTKRTYPRAASA